MRKILNEQFARINADPSLGRRYVVIPSPVTKPVAAQDLIAQVGPGIVTSQESATTPAESRPDKPADQLPQRNVRAARK